MMNKVISIKTDATTKHEAQKLAKDLGLTLSGLINSYLKQVIVTRRVNLVAPEQMTPRLEKMVAKVEADIQAGKNLSRPFDNLDELFDDLESDEDNCS